MREIGGRLLHEIKGLETRLHHEIRESELALRCDMAEIKSDLPKWLVGLLFLQAGFIVALIKLV
jgi:hypothetical protein